ncbi:MAG: HAMP domain-containing protein [candidate division NC10 bacterium]|nr:HAMP domain-containing protein [candidate division NC10 bacterium]
MPVLHSLKVKFVAALILLVGLVIGLSTWWTLEVHRKHMLHATEDKVRALTEAIDRGIHVAMREGRSQDVQRILEEVGRDPDIEKIIIFDTHGKILRASQVDLVGRVLDRDRLSRYLDQADLAVTGLHENGQLVQSVVKKIRNRPECFACHGTGEAVNGILHVDMSFRKTQEQIAEMEGTALWTMLLTAAVLAAGGAILMVRLVERPVGSLIRAMAKVEGGDLETRAGPGQRDELGRLADSFNTMVDRLKAARAEIEAFHHQRLARAERLATLGELAASLAHEVKNPLAGIAGAIQVMADELPEADPKREIMREILEQVHRLDKTVRDLLAFARPGKPDIGPCDIHQVLDRVLILLAENPAAKQVRVVRAYQPGVPSLDADSKQLGQVFLNLLLNAIQAMPTGGSVTIATRLVRNGDRQSVVASTGQFGGTERSDRRDQLTNRLMYQSTSPSDGRWVEVTLTDTGPGIPPHLLQDIFNPFFTTKHRGSGLGLSVSRRIVEDHGGWIEAESSPGQGATFRVWLPVGAVTHRTGEPLA